MPKCIECKHFIDNHCIFASSRAGLGWDQPGKPLVSACGHAIVLKLTSRWKPGDQILEIGPGANWKRVPRQVKAIPGARWHGLDPRWTTNEKAGRYRGIVGNIPFPDSFFDWVVSFGSIEHWAERNRDTVPNGMRECLRVLKPGGIFLAGLPIYFHGTKEFVAGDLDKIFSYFSSPEWESMRVEEWRRDVADAAYAIDPMNPYLAGWFMEVELRKRDVV